MASTIDLKRVPHVDSFIVDIIIEYLPKTTQLAINKDRYTKIIPMYHAFKNTIVRAIRHNRARMNDQMDLRPEEVTLELMRAHYILHYPNKYRWDYYRHALAYKLQCNHICGADAHLNNLYSRTSSPSVKYLFRKMIMNMSLDELFICGW